MRRRIVGPQRQRPFVEGNGLGVLLPESEDVAQVVESLDKVRVQTHGVPDRVIAAAPRARQLAICGLTPEGIADRVRAMLESEALAG